MISDLCNTWVSRARQKRGACPQGTGSLTVFGVLSVNISHLRDLGLLAPCALPGVRDVVCIGI